MTWRHLDAELESDPDKAFSLFAVLLFLLFAATISIPFVTSARTQALIVRNVASELRDRLASRGLIEISANRLFLSYRQTDFDVPQSLVCRLEKSAIEIDFQNHAGLIDLNAASADLLTVGFRALGAGASDAHKMAQDTIKFRSVSTGSADAPPLEIRGGYKHALFESVDELLDFSLPSSLAKFHIKNVFTVQSATGTILDTAIAEPINHVLKELPPAATYFVVSGQPPLGAVTVSIAVSRAGKNQVLASTIVRPSGANSSPEFVSPMAVTWQPKSGAVTNRGQSPCSDFFSASELLAMEMLIGGDA